MKRILNNSLKSILIMLVLLIICCCQNSVNITTPLFTVSQPEYRAASQDRRCKIGGVYFDFYNKADCCVTYIETSMNVYDKKTGKNAFTGFGTIKSENEVIIKSGSTRQLCIPLDDYITVTSEEGYLIDQFYVSRIEYEDGSVYTDDFGLYAAGGQ